MKVSRRFYQIFRKEKKKRNKGKTRRPSGWLLEEPAYLSISHSLFPDPCCSLCVPRGCLLLSQKWRPLAFPLKFAGPRSRQGLSGRILEVWSSLQIGPGKSLPILQHMPFQCPHAFSPTVSLTSPLAPTSFCPFSPFSFGCLSQFLDEKFFQEEPETHFHPYQKGSTHLWLGRGSSKVTEARPLTCALFLGGPNLYLQGSQLLPEGLGWSGKVWEECHLDKVRGFQRHLL